MKHCPECGAPCDETCTYCAECGFDLGSLKCCEECGALIGAGDEFCPECGNPTGNVRSAAAPTAEMPCNIGKSTANVAYAPAAATTLAPSAAKTECAAAVRAKNRITVYNIIALIALIPSTIIVAGEVFIIQAGEALRVDFGFLKVSDFFANVNSILEKLKSYDDGALDNLRDMTAILSFVKYIFYIVLIYVAYQALMGILSANDGVMLKKVFLIPIGYSVACIIFYNAMNKCLLERINDFLNNNLIGIGLQYVIDGELHLGFNPQFSTLLGIALLLVGLYFLLHFIEKKVAKRNNYSIDEKA